MSKCDFDKRLKSIILKECEITKLESKIAHKSAKYLEKLSSLKIILDEQEQSLAFYRKELEKLKTNNERLEKYKQKREEELCKTIQSVEQTQSEYENAIQEQIEQRRTDLMQMDCIFGIKDATQTYFKVNEIAQKLQFVTLCHKESSCEWKPFCIDPLELRKKEVQDMIWHGTQADSEYRETWEKLILTEKATDMKAESDIDTKDSI